MEITREDELQAFEVEAAEHLDAIEHKLLAIEASGFDALSLLAHGAEDLLDRLRNRTLAPSASVVGLLLEVVDALRRATRRVLAVGQDPGPEDLARLGRLAPAAVAREAHAVTSPDAAPSTAGATSTPSARTLRIGVDKLDRLVDLVGEIAIARGLDGANLNFLRYYLDSAEQGGPTEAQARVIERYTIASAGRKLQMRLQGALSPLETEHFAVYARERVEAKPDGPVLVYLDVQGLEATSRASLEHLREWLDALYRRGEVAGVVVGPHSLGGGNCTECCVNRGSRMRSRHLRRPRPRRDFGTGSKGPRMVSR